MAPFEAVAKIYDPLYYSFSSDIGNYPCDVVLRADEDYAQEVAAYECLTRAGQTGSFAPAYFGSEWLRHEFGGKKKASYEPVLEELEFYKPPQEDLAAMPME
ncbi:hypothetical protein LA080_009725 [Diaporthe eres]|nr:hypothetical protein LA080_009725 [Diaporthe eres]